ncbi:MAG TPA: hypothetical protein PLP27_07385 [Crocinitomicaceae bacterium]|nr:hypothetical protein [Crocinitomicaceae bacterium]
MKNKKLAIVLPLFIIGILGIAFAVYWFFLRKKDEETPQNPNGLVLAPLDEQPTQRVQEPLVIAPINEKQFETQVVAIAPTKLNAMAERLNVKLS